VQYFRWVVKGESGKIVNIAATKDYYKAGENIDLVWMPGDGIWQVKIDPSQVNQIVLNLCVNARQAIDGVGKIIIEIDNVTVDKAYCVRDPDWAPGDYVLLRVSDSGCGMSRETLSRVFEPFFTTKGVGEGTGLGLATVYGIVKQNRGSINVYSEPGHGTVFSIYLPRNKDDVAASEEKVEEKLPVSRGETVLLVEDEIVVLGLGKILLEGQGYTVLSANSPLEALNIAETHEGKIHLLLTDVVMPGMNGRDLSERLHKLRPDIKTVFMSGYEANSITGHTALKGSVHFLQKPFTLKDLAVKVREALDQ
jgi:CheY-like chemotaxis protein